MDLVKRLCQALIFMILHCCFLKKDTLYDDITEIILCSLCIAVILVAYIGSKLHLENLQYNQLSMTGMSKLLIAGNIFITLYQDGFLRSLSMFHDVVLRHLSLFYNVVHVLHPLIFCPFRLPFPATVNQEIKYTGKQ